LELSEISNHLIRASIKHFFLNWLF